MQKNLNVKLDRANLGLPSNRDALASQTDADEAYLAGQNAVIAAVANGGRAKWLPFNEVTQIRMSAKRD